MPELPEVETVCRGLRQLLVGRTIQSVTSLWTKSFPQSDHPVLPGAAFESVERRAKLVILHLDRGFSLLVHLKMTGQLVFVSDSGERFGAGHPSGSLVDHLPDRSTRIVFKLDGARLYFNDQRKFGWIQLLPDNEIADLTFVRKLGPEPLSGAFTCTSLADGLRRRKGTTIKAALLDQTVLAGIGNIYADEALWTAGLHPARRVASLDDTDIERLHGAIRRVLSISIEAGGSSSRNYVNAEGKRGAYLDFAEVFRRQGQACRRCGTTIIKTRVAGRGTHLCPHCQKEFIDWQE